MIPILYEKDEVAFTSNGLGRLRDCISCKVTEERNGIYECDFEYPTDGVRFDSIQVGRIIGVQHDDNGDIQPFDIVSYTKPIDKIVTFHCVHISYRQSYLTMDTSAMAAFGPGAAMSNMKTYAVPTNPFNYGTDVSSTADFLMFDGQPRTVRSMLGGSEGSILDQYGGEFEWDVWSVYLHNSRGVYRNFAIRYGVNMTEFSDETDSQGTYMSVIPYWKNGDEYVIGDKVDSTGITAGGHNECVPLDVTDKFDSKPTKAQVEQMATDLMQMNNPFLPVQNIKVSFVRLQDLGYDQFENLMKCQLCDTIKVYFPDYNVSGTFKIVKVVWDVLSDRYDEMELGALSTSLSEALGIKTKLDTTSSGGGVTGVKGNSEGTYRTGNVNLTYAQIGAQKPITSTTDLSVNKLNASSHIYAEGYTSSNDYIGYIPSAVRNTSTVTVNTGTATDICSISLTKGHWLVCCGLRFPSNTSGYRCGKLSSSSANISVTNADVILFAQNMSGTNTQLQWTKIINETRTSGTWYLEALQNSGSSLTMPTGGTQTYTNPYGSYIHAIRIA